MSTEPFGGEARPWEGPCGCGRYCGDDGDTEGPGVCKGLPCESRSPLVEFFVVHRDDDWRTKGVAERACPAAHDSEEDSRGLR